MTALFLFSFHLASVFGQIDLNDGCPPYSYLLLRLEWRPSDYPTTAYSKSLPYFKNDFNIHGLWPQYSKPCHSSKGTVFGPYGEVFNKSERKYMEFMISTCKINDPKKSILGFWDSYKSEQFDLWFYNHEWEKHGVFSTDIPQLANCEIYFENIVKLFQKVQVLDKLKLANITPKTSDERPDGYRIKEFFEAFEKKINLKFTNFKVKKGKEYLKYIEICFDKKLEMIDCEGQIQPKNLKEPVYFPSLSEFRNNKDL